MTQATQGIEILVEFYLKPNVLENFVAILLPHLERVASEETCITMIANRDPNDGRTKRSFGRCR